jgi:hypothetical protein
MDVAATGVITDPDPPRPINPGDPFAYRIELTETSGVREATSVIVEGVFDDPCFDLTDFDERDVSVRNSSALIDWNPVARSLTVSDLTVPAGETVTIEAADLLLSSTEPCTELCARARVSYLHRPGNPHTRGDRLTEDPDTSSCGDSTCLWIHPKTYLRKGGVEPALCPLAGRPDLGALFPLPALVFVELPYEDPGYGLSLADPGSPADNSCLIFYRVDEVDRIVLRRQWAGPTADVRIESP